MAYFEWANDLVIDGGAIVADHLILVDPVNELHTATRQGTGHDVVAPVLERLIIYTKEHLAHREQLMASTGFLNLERHKIGHKHSTVLREWLSLHIGARTKCPSSSSKGKPSALLGRMISVV